MSEKNAPKPEWWNRVSGLAGKILGKTEEPESEEEIDPALVLAQRRAQALETLRVLIAGNKGAAALALFHKTVRACETWELPENEVLHLTELLCTEKLWNAAVPFLEDYLRRFEKRAIQVRLRLAKVLIEQQQRPAYASQIMAELPAEGLGEKEQKVRGILEAKAQKMIEDGVLELEGRPW